MGKRKASSKRSKTPRVWRRLFQLSAFIALGVAAYSGWFWYEMQSWRPDVALYPEQGAVIASGASDVRFETLRATGAEFVYLALSPARSRSSEKFRANLKAAKAAGLKVGILQVFDPCVRADPQSARFTRMVARDSGLLPPALAVTRLPASCSPKVSGAAFTSEVITLINQIEGHAGKPIILRLSEAVESRFRFADGVDRDLWLERDRLRPTYAQRPWLLWSANSQLVNEASKEPLEWVVVQK